MHPFALYAVQLVQLEQVAQLKRLAEAKRAARKPESALAAAERLVVAVRVEGQAGAEQLVYHEHDEREEGWGTVQ